MRICAVMDDGKRYQTDVDEKDLFIAVGKAIQKFREQGIPTEHVRTYTTVNKNEKFDDDTVRPRLKIYRDKYCSRCGELIVGKSKRGEVNKETGRRVWLCLDCATTPN